MTVIWCLQIWQSWLLPSSEKEFKEQQANRIKAPEGFHQKNKGHEHDHEHKHEHEHGHKHEERTKVEMDAIKAEGDDAERARLIQCLIKVQLLPQNHRLIQTDEK